MPHSIVLELLYILTGIALSYTFVGLHKVVVVFFSGQKVFVPYLIISFILPVIIWQHTYEISNQIEIIQRTYATRGEDFKSFFSLVSLFELVTWATLFGIIVTVFPVKEKIKYSMTSKKWKEHVKTNRRIFFLLCFAYIIEVIYCNKLLEIETGVLINLSRCMMLSACGWSFLLNFERVNKHLNYNIRIVVPKFGINRNTISIKKRRFFIRYSYYQFNNARNTREERQALYNAVDFIAIIFMLGGFLTTSISRYLL